MTSVQKPNKTASNKRSRKNKKPKINMGEIDMSIRINTGADTKPKSDVNETYYLSIRKKYISLYDIYNIDEIDRIAINTKPMNMTQLNSFITLLTTNDDNHYACVLEQIAAFLIYPKSDANKKILLKRMTDYIKSNEIQNSFDIIKNYEQLHKIVTSNSIIILFDFDVDKILNYVKNLKHSDNICEILNGLYDNNTVRIL